MKIKMELISDTIFGSGFSVPGGEDISVLHDENGFPFFRGTTLKGLFREEMERYIEWSGNKTLKADELLGKGGDEEFDNRIIFSDLRLSQNVRDHVSREIAAIYGNTNFADVILDTMTNTRIFTKINKNGVADKGSLRMARCVNAGLIFYGEIICDKEIEKEVEEILCMIKWVGTMRNRGFGKVRISRGEEI